MRVTVYSYAKCSTCQKALKWLAAQKHAADVMPIVESPPSAKQLADWVRRSGKPVTKWFNTSGQSYRALIAARGKAAVAALTEAQALALLAADGKLIKRPILVTGTSVCVGFAEAEWKAAL